MKSKQILLRNVPIEIYEKIILDKIKLNNNIDDVVVNILIKHYGQKNGNAKQ